MASDDAPILTEVSWEDRRWWNGALRRETALDYFALSQFYDRTCLNEQLKMQRTLLSAETMREKLSRLPGIVYHLDEARTEEVAPTTNDVAHTLYVIRKLERAPGGRETTLRYYYILDGIVYEAPTIAAVLRARMLKMGWHLREAFDQIRTAVAADEDTASEKAAARAMRKRQRDGHE